MSATISSTALPTAIHARSRWDWPATVGRLVLAAVLGAAAVTKITDPTGTVRSVRAYRLLPDALATAFGRGLPALELALAVLLLLGIALRATACMAGLLLACFTAGITSAAARGLRIDCGCFGSGGPTAHPHYAGEIARDVALVALALGLVRHGRSRLALDPRPPVLPADSSDRRARVVAEMRHKAALDRHSRGRRLLAVGAVAVAAASASVGIAVGTASAPGAPSAVPTGVTAAGGVLVGSATAPHKVIAYEDPQCPICGEFERTSGSVLAAAVASGEVQVEYRMRSFLGPESVRADAALGAAQDEGRFAALRAALFAHQPAERTGGYTVADLLQLGASVGLTDARFIDAVRNQTYAAWARQVDDRAARDGNTGTPQLLLDGSELSTTVVFDPTALRTALGG